MEHLLRERNHINNSLNAAGGVIDQAEAVRTDLRLQGRGLRNTQGLLGALTTNIPGLNTLVEQIRRKRSRDDKIVAGVIATCILFTLWYLFG
jgi:Golgi SNAP receptor complex protein 1